MVNIPTTEGWYWWRLKEEHRWKIVDVGWREPAHFTLLVMDDVDDEEEELTVQSYPGEWGPRIPYPEELEDTAYVLSRLIEEVIDAGWHPSHVEDAVEIVKRIRKGGDA